MQNDNKQQCHLKYLQDSDGNYSSKRLIAVCLAAFLGIVFVAIMWCSIVQIELTNQGLINKIIEWSVMGSVFLGLGGTAFEKVLPALTSLMGKNKTGEK